MKEIRKKEVTITLGLDKDNVPEQIWWGSSDENAENPPEVKAMLLSLFDKDSKDTLKLDLWTKDFQTNEMDRFMYHTLRTLADSYYKATKNQSLANHMQQFAQFFGEQTEILAKETK